MNPRLGKMGIKRRLMKDSGFVGFHVVQRNLRLWKPEFIRDGAFFPKPRQRPWRLLLQGRGYKPRQRPWRLLLQGRLLLLFFEKKFLTHKRKLSYNSEYT